MRFRMTMVFISALLVFIPSIARADATYNFTVNVVLKDLSKTLNGQPLRYFVSCAIVDTQGASHSSVFTELTSIINAAGNFSGPVKLAITTPLPAKTYQCRIQANQNQAFVSAAVADAAVWDPAKSSTLVSGNIP